MLKSLVVVKPHCHRSALQFTSAVSTFWLKQFVLISEVLNLVTTDFHQQQVAVFIKHPTGDTKA